MAAPQLTTNRLRTIIRHSWRLGTHTLGPVEWPVFRKSGFRAVSSTHLPAMEIDFVIRFITATHSFLSDLGSCLTGVAP